MSNRTLGFSDQARPSYPLLSLELPRLLLRSLLPLTQLSLDSNATEHTCNTDPLHASEAVSEPDHRDDHGKHFSGDSDSDQEKRAEDRQCVDCWDRISKYLTAC